MRPSRILGVGSSKTDRSFEFTADLLAAIFTWGGVGWLADRALGTGPLLMAVGFVVGNAAGIYLLYIRTQDREPIAPEDTGADSAGSPTAHHTPQGPPAP